MTSTASRSRERFKDEYWLFKLGFKIRHMINLHYREINWTVIKIHFLKAIMKQYLSIIIVCFITKVGLSRLLN